jgi:hypothetical protein
MAKRSSSDSGGRYRPVALAVKRSRRNNGRGTNVQPNSGRDAKLGDAKLGDGRNLRNEKLGDEKLGSISKG